MLTVIVIASWFMKPWTMKMLWESTAYALVQMDSSSQLRLGITLSGYVLVFAPFVVIVAAVASKPNHSIRHDFLALQIWSIADRQIRNRFLGHTGETLSSIVLSPDGRPIVSASGVGRVRVWDMSDGSSKTIASPYALRGPISPDGRLVAGYELNGVRRFLVTCRMSDGFPSHRPYVSGTPVRTNCWKRCGDKKIEFFVWPSPLMDVGWWAVAQIKWSSTGTYRVWRIGQMVAQLLRLCQTAVL